MRELPMPSLSTAASELQRHLAQGSLCVNELWRVETRNWVTSVYAADINLDGDIEVLAGSRDGRAYVVSRDGQQIGDNIVGNKAWVSSIIGLSGTLDQQSACILAGSRNGKIYLLDKEGKEIPIRPAGPDPSSSSTHVAGYLCDVQQSILQLQAHPAAPETLIFGSENGNAYGFDIANRKILWTFRTDGLVQAIAVCDLKGDNCLVTLVGSADHSLTALSSSGTPLAQRQMDQAIFSLLAADIDGDGEIEILVGTRTKKLYALAPDLSEKWSLSLSSRPLALAVADINNDQRSEIIIACDDQSLTILDDSGMLIWRQKQNKRFYSFYAIDLDRDGQTEILAGSDDNSIYALRIQLSKDLDKEILRNYTALDKPDPSTLLMLTPEQRELLLDLVGPGNNTFDHNLSLERAETLLAEGNEVDALYLLLKLDQQKFQLLWEKEEIGYNGTLCVATISNNPYPAVIVSLPEGGISAFTPTGQLLWSETLTDSQITDVQSGYLSRGNSEDLAFISSTDHLWLMNMDKKREILPFDFPEPIACFHVLAPGHQAPPELLIGSKNGEVCLYTNDFHIPAQTFTLPGNADIVYATEPHEGLYRTPDILIATAPNQLLAYTRGGKKLWEFETHDRILALCAKDLEGDGHLDVLIGAEDCNIYMLDYQGNLRWRYFLYHSVLTLETADLDGDGNLEILVGCADSIFYVFKSTGDLIWRYQAKDRIQALRVIDVDQDGNRAIAVVSEGHLEILQMINQRKLADLIEDCWSLWLENSKPLEALLPLIQHANPVLRAAALNKLSKITPLPSDIFHLLETAIHDTVVNVRKALTEAVMRIYHSDNVRARPLLDALFSDRQRDVRIEVIEHLELLAPHDWNTILLFLNRSIQSSDRNTRRAAIRKISHLIGGATGAANISAKIPAEALFRLLLDAAQGVEREWGKSEWIKQEAARVLADLLNHFPEDFLVYLYQLLKHQVSSSTLKTIAFNLTLPNVQQAFASLLALSLDLNEANAPNLLATTTKALEAVHDVRQGADIWLIFHEFQELFDASTLEDLAVYEFHLKQEQFQDINYTIQSFLRIGERFSTITRHLKTYQRRSDPNDRLKSLLDGLNALEALQHLANSEYRASLIPGSPQPPEPEFVAIRTLLARWREMFTVQINKLRGRADLVFELPLRQVYFEEKVAIWLQITNRGRDIAHNVRVTLLNNEHCEILRPSSQIRGIFPQQQTAAEFLIRPSTPEPLTLTIEILYDDSQSNPHAFTIQEVLEFVEWPHTFTHNENLYATGTPTQNSRMFYGREVELDYLRDNLTRTMAQTVVVLHGQRRSGKTTLLYQLVNSARLSEHVPVMVDLQSLATSFTIGNFLFRVSYAIYQAMNKRGLSVVKPVRTDFIAQKEYSPDPTFAFDCFLDDIETILGEQKLILLLDEFEELDTQVSEGILNAGIFEYLRSLMQKRQYVRFLLSGTHHIEQLTRDYWSIFFNIALHYRLPGKITASGAEDLITRPMSDSFEYDTLAVTKIRQLTADQPYLIHLVCGSLIAHCNEAQKNYATLHDVNIVLDKVIDTGTVHFSWLWKQLEAAQRLLLQVIAEGTKESWRKVSLEDIHAIYDEYGYIYNRDEVVASLKALRDEDVVETNKDDKLDNVSSTPLYHIPIGLLRHWLRHEQPLEKMQNQDRKIE
jgi:outer membrane protein assembly factor BamB